MLSLSNKTHAFLDLRKLYYFFPPKGRLIARRLYYLPVDLLDRLTGKRPSMVPPKGLIYTGPGDFIKIGQTYLDHFIKLGRLMPHHHVLDVGSGIGRMAVPLTDYLTTGEYDGFDIIKIGVDWCKKHISRKHKNFRFIHINLKNDLYSASGKEAIEFTFPYPDEKFDFVFLTSVFTHMVPAETEHYMKEIARVTKKGGRCLATFFIINPATDNYIKQSGNTMFPFDKGHYRLMNDSVTSANVAYTDDYILHMLAQKNGFIINTIKYGSWSGRPKDISTDFQDIVVFEKII